MKQEDIYQFAMDQALELIILFESDGKIIYANESAKNQLEYEELCGRFIEDIFPGEFRNVNINLETDYEFGVKVREMTAYRKNRTCFPVRTRMLRWEGNPGTYICMAYDISKVKFLEKKAVNAGTEAEAAEKVKSEFVANVTHELRTPVNGILGNARELMSIETEEKKLRLLRLVERGCNDMHAIINNILDFSKLEAGKFILEPRKFNLRNMMDYVKSNHINKITEKGLEFFVTISPEVPEYIIGDELRIVQILNNLISNACKFTMVGKIVVEVVKTAQIDNRIELFFLVIDTGIGIDKADVDKLFKSFSQVDASISRKFGGTGLGLNICKQLVELMDGNIRVESEPGRGSMFCFHIWVEVPQEEMEHQKEVMENNAPQNILQSLSDIEKNQDIWEYGKAENREEIRKKMSKLILSVEMENWEKAEMFAETIKQLTKDAPGEVKSVALRLKMAVQKGDYEKVTTAFETLQGII
ncbi:MAG: ATP-binding protein [Clostridiales bacterium]|nr:ATP-binding protein [Roseburia sp.]MDD7636010.1 ATP-binding protein [Clostridiales bacterium]MDY4114148.1 ATP-binding protein [Roseburia sp.]